jgi:DNA-binding protein Fis
MNNSAEHPSGTTPEPIVTHLEVDVVAESESQENRTSRRKLVAARHSAGKNICQALLAKKIFFVTAEMSGVESPLSSRQSSRLNRMVSIDDRLNAIIRELIGNGITLEQAVEAFEGKYIVAAMSASRGNVTQASKKLGVHRNTLHNKLRTQTMLNGFAESVRPVRRRLSAKRVSAPSTKGNNRSGRSTRRQTE